MDFKHIDTNATARQFAIEAGRGDHSALQELLGQLVDKVFPEAVTLADGTLTLNAGEHEGRTVVVTKADGVTITLPVATGSGHRYRIVTGVVVSGGNLVVQAGQAADDMVGHLAGISLGDTPDLAQPWVPGGTDDTITFNGTTTGGAAKGDIIELVDIAAETWGVSGTFQQSGTEATPFSAAVT